jgi:hypothetical protein
MICVNVLLWHTTDLGDAVPSLCELAIFFAFNLKVCLAIRRGIQSESVKAFILHNVLEHAGTCCSVSIGNFIRLPTSYALECGKLAILTIGLARSGEVVVTISCPIKRESSHTGVLDNLIEVSRVSAWLGMVHCGCIPALHWGTFLRLCELRHCFHISFGTLNLEVVLATRLGIKSVACVALIVDDFGEICFRIGIFDGRSSRIVHVCGHTAEIRLTIVTIWVALLMITRWTDALVVVQQILAVANTTSFWPTVINVSTYLLTILVLNFIATLTVALFFQKLIFKFRVRS